MTFSPFYWANYMIYTELSPFNPHTPKTLLIPKVKSPESCQFSDTPPDFGQIQYQKPWWLSHSYACNGIWHKTTHCIWLATLFLHFVVNLTYFSKHKKDSKLWHFMRFPSISWQGVPFFSRRVSVERTVSPWCFMVYLVLLLPLIPAKEFFPRSSIGVSALPSFPFLGSLLFYVAYWS